jgi:hypothetical protein
VDGGRDDEGHRSCHDPGDDWTRVTEQLSRRADDWDVDEIERVGGLAQPHRHRVRPDPLQDGDRCKHLLQDHCSPGQTGDGYRQRRLVSRRHELRMEDECEHVAETDHGGAQKRGAQPAHRREQVVGVQQAERRADEDPGDP